MTITYILLYVCRCMPVTTSIIPYNAPTQASTLAKSQTVAIAARISRPIRLTFAPRLPCRKWIRSRMCFRVCCSAAGRTLKLKNPSCATRRANQGDHLEIRMYLLLYL